LEILNESLPTLYYQTVVQLLHFMVYINTIVIQYSIHLLLKHLSNASTTKSLAPQLFL